MRLLPSRSELLQLLKELGMIGDQSGEGWNEGITIDGSSNPVSGAKFDDSYAL